MDTLYFSVTSPPKTVLEPEQRLVEVGLVGSAVVYFGSEVTIENYLKPEVLGQLSCPKTVDEYLQSLDHQEKPPLHPLSMETQKDHKDQQPPQQVSGPPPQVSGPPQVPYPSTPNTSGNNRPIGHATRIPTVTDRVPKWFKPTK